MNYDSKIDMDTATDPVGEPSYADRYGSPEAGKAGGTTSGMRLWLIAIFVMAVIVGIWFLLHGGSSGDEAADAGAQVPVVTVTQPGRSTVAGAISATGSLAARRAMPVGSVGEGGQVRSVLVEPGEWVSKGQTLAVIDRSVQSQQIASQAAQVRVAEADARLAQSNLDRALQLVDRGFISKADVDRLTATRDAANARVQVANATLGQLQASAARLNIVAPESGLVLTRNVEPGQVVTGGSGVLFSIAKGGEMELLARLGEDELAALSVGVKADVMPVGSNQTFTGEVWQISPVIDQTTRQGTARIALNYDPALRPGGFASATIASGTVVAPMLPESAIQNDDKGAFVYVVDADDKVRRQAVKTGLVTANGIVVTDGLNGTEKIVLRAGGFLNPGDKVKPQPARPGK